MQSGFSETVRFIPQVFVRVNLRRVVCFALRWAAPSPNLFGARMPEGILGKHGVLSTEPRARRQAESCFLSPTQGNITENCNRPCSALAKLPPINYRKETRHKRVDIKRKTFLHLLLCKPQRQRVRSEIGIYVS